MVFSGNLHMAASRYQSSRLPKPTRPAAPFVARFGGVAGFPSLHIQQPRTSSTIVLHETGEHEHITLPKTAQSADKTEHTSVVPQASACANRQHAAWGKALPFSHAGVVTEHIPLQSGYMATITPCPEFMPGKQQPWGFNTWPVEDPVMSLKMDKITVLPQDLPPLECKAPRAFTGRMAARRAGSSRLPAVALMPTPAPVAPIPTSTIPLKTDSSEATNAATGAVAIDASGGGVTLGRDTSARVLDIVDASPAAVGLPKALALVSLPKVTPPPEASIATAPVAAFVASLESVFKGMAAPVPTPIPAAPVSTAGDLLDQVQGLTEAFQLESRVWTAGVEVAQKQQKLVRMDMAMEAHARHLAMVAKRQQIAKKGLARTQALMNKAKATIKASEMTNFALRVHFCGRVVDKGGDILQTKADARAAQVKEFNQQLTTATEKIKALVQGTRIIRLGRG